MVTKKDIRARFNLRGEVNIKQVSSKQLFIVDCPINGRLLLSYYTVVGYFNDRWYLTKYKYSQTTSRQLTQFANSTNFQVEWIDKQITLKVQ
jgi:hypothetical protein